MSLFNFTKTDLGRLFANKFVLVIGDSVMRTVYKDIVVMLQFGRHLTTRECKEKGETAFNNDELIEGGKMTNGKDYREVRQFLTSQHLIRFYFVTRVYNGYVETIFADIHKSLKPDIVIVNSCLWDISRYGAFSMDSYKKNLQKFCYNLKQLLTPQSVVIWTTTLPVSSQIRAGVLTQGTGFLSEILRLDVLVANNYASQVAKRFGFGLLDLHFIFRNQLHLLAKDGVHWVSEAHRNITNVIVGYACLALNIIIPHRCRLDRLLLPTFDHGRSLITYNDDCGLSFADNEGSSGGSLLITTMSSELRRNELSCVRKIEVSDSRWNRHHTNHAYERFNEHGSWTQNIYDANRNLSLGTHDSYDFTADDNFRDFGTSFKDFNWKPYQERGPIGVSRHSGHRHVGEVGRQGGENWYTHKNARSSHGICRQDDFSHLRNITNVSNFQGPDSFRHYRGHPY